MKISICIPHYNRAEYLLKVIDSVHVQSYKEIELVITDDCSKDNSAEVIPARLAGLPIESRYLRHEKNIGYDANLRSAMEAASGDYLFILGNDDALADEHAISYLAGLLEENDLPEVAVCNYYPWGRPEEVQRRVQFTGIAGRGPETAIKTYRTFSFVAGIIYKRSAFLAHNTGEHDHSVFVQIYLAARIIAAGGALLEIERPLVAKDVQKDGAMADSYRDKLVRGRWVFSPRNGGLRSVGKVASAAIIPFIAGKKKRGAWYDIYAQILKFSYPYWLYDYRKNNAYGESLNMALGCFPPFLMAAADAPPLTALRLCLPYAAATVAGLFIPLWLLDRVKGAVYRLSRRIG